MMKKNILIRAVKYHVIPHLEYHVRVICLGFGWLVVLFYIHDKHLRSCRDGQLT